jgi:Tfp pilus assembly protein PilE
MRKGFTLLETIISVILVIAIASTVYSVNSTSRLSIDKSNNSLDNAMKYTLNLFYPLDIDNTDIYIKENISTFDTDNDYFLKNKDIKIKINNQKSDMIKLHNTQDIEIIKQTLKIENRSLSIIRLN